jgi:hypothetical protein
MPPHPSASASPRQPRLRDHQRRVARQDGRQHSRGARGATFAALPFADRAERGAGGAGEFLLRQAGLEPTRRNEPLASRSRPDVDDRDKPTVVRLIFSL